MAKALLNSADRINNSLAWGGTMRALLIFLLLFSLVVPAYSKDTKKETQKEKEISETEKTKNKYNDIVEFGTSNQRIGLIQEIIKNKDKEFYPYIKSFLQTDTDARVQQFAVEAVNTLEIKDYAPQVHDLIHTDKPFLQAQIIYTLGQLEFSQAEADILKIFNDSKKDMVKSACIKAFGKLKTKNALDGLYKLYKAPKISGDAKLAILMSIGEIGDESSIPFLEEILAKEYSPSLERSFSAGALGQIGGTKAKEILRKYSHDKDKRVSMAVLKAFGDKEDGQSQKIIQKSLRNDDAEIRYSALESLEKNIKPEHFRILQYMVFNDNHINVRKKAVEILSKMGGEKVVSIMLNEMEKDKSGLKYEFVKVAHNLDKKDASKVLAKAFELEENNKYRKFILDQLFDVDPKYAVKVLNKRVMNKDDSLFLGIKLYAIALIHKKMKKEGIPALEKYISHDNLHVRRYSYYYLIMLNEKSSHKNIFKFLKDEKNEKVVTYVLGIFRDKEIKEVLPLLKEFKYKSHLVSKELREVITALEKK